MTTLTIIDSLSLPGHPQKPNEDRCGWTETRAFVVDGATGVGDDVMDSNEGSDAAWIAERARAQFDAADELRVDETLRRINTDARAAFQAKTGNSSEPWQQPVAGFTLIEWRQDRLIAAGLGDCVLFILDQTGEPARLSPMAENHDHETETARAALRAGSTLIDGASITSTGSLLEREKAMRARYNTAGGPIWTLGIAPEAADYLWSEPVDLQAPLRGLVCTDGFAALVDRYQRFTLAGLIEAASAEGLARLGETLRRIEHEEDPEGRQFPRMKRSDDATAVLFEVT